MKERMPNNIFAGYASEYLLKKKNRRARKAVNSIQENKFRESGHESERVSWPTTVLSFSNPSLRLVVWTKLRPKTTILHKTEQRATQLDKHNMFVMCY